MIRIEIPDWHPAPLNKQNAHWTVRHRLKKADREMVAFYSRTFPKAKVKRLLRLTIVLGKGERGCDVDAYDKSLLDALVHAGMLVDDSKNWVVKAPNIYERAKTKATIIELEDLA